MSSILDKPGINLDEIDENTLSPEEKKKLKVLKAKAKARATKEAQGKKQLEKEKEAVDKWELPKGEKHFKITKWFAGGNSVCSICKEPLQSLCVQCSSSNHISRSQDDNCSVAGGKCGHLYHEHCISNWLRVPNQQNKKCPHCLAPWEFSTKAM